MIGYILRIRRGDFMKLRINPDAKIKLEEENLKDKYIKLFYCGFG